jgi:hypothetical protein
MTKEDRKTVLALALEKQTRNENGINIGGLWLKKKDGGDAYGFEVALLLNHTARQGTYMWDMDDPTTGLGVFNNIYEAMAADIHAPDGTLRVRMEKAQDHGAEVRSGVATLANWLQEMWGIPLFRCQRAKSGNKVTCITVDPNVIVDEVTKRTAAESQRERDTQVLAGQTQAAYNRIGRQFGETAAAMALNKAVEAVLHKPLPVPRMKALEDRD